MELILLVVATLFAILIIFFLKQKKVHKLPPGPPGLPFIGNLHQLDKSNPHKYFKQLSDKYGPLMSMKLGSRITLVVSSSRLAEEVMKKQDLIFCSRPKFLGQQKFSYNGKDMAFSTYNDTWRQMRKIAVIHLLSITRVQSFRAIREDEITCMIEEISKAASLSKIIDLNETMMSVSNTITCRMTFGKKYGKEDDQERLTFFDVVIKAQDLMVSFFFSDYFPLLGWLDKFTGANSRLEIIFLKLDSIFQKFIESHLDTNRPNSMDNDIVDLLLRLKDDESTGIYTVEHIKAFIMNILIAGTETTSTIIIFTMTALIKCPSAMIKVQSEIRTVLGNKEMVDEDDCRNLPYLNAVIKEAFRLYPPVPMLVPRETMEKCTLDGYEIQPKTMVYINAWAIARDPKVWENPDEFLPERFLNSNIDVKGKDFEVIPFGAGRRICPAVSMVLATVEPILANLLYLFDWSLPSGMEKEDIDTDVLPGITMGKKNHLLLHAYKHNT